MGFWWFPNDWLNYPRYGGILYIYKQWELLTNKCFLDSIFDYFKKIKKMAARKQ